MDSTPAGEGSSMSSLIGRVIDNYRLESLLGDGGMGTVYRAYDVNLERWVAIKLMHPHFARQPEFRARLRQEAKAAAALDHPSIVRILDFGDNGDVAYIVMEYVGGGSLRAHLQRLQSRERFLPIQQSLQIGYQMADALGYAHTRGMIHRDVKPSNIILKQTGRPEEKGEAPFRAVLTDFGLVKLISGDFSLTQSGTTLGTPTYMSPEQCQGLELDGRSDIYALGVLLYELLTNKLPFQFKSLAEAIATHMRGEMPPRVRDLRPDVPAVADAIVAKALAKAPADRFVSGEAMAAALRGAIYSLSDAPTRVLPAEDEDELVLGEAPPGYALEIITPGREPTTVALSRALIAIGRDAENDIVLPSEGVSRNHARLQATPDGWQVLDLGGVNGTALNGQRLQPRQPAALAPGASLQIGPYELIVHGPESVGLAAVSPALATPVPEQPTQPPESSLATPGPMAPRPPLEVFLARDRVAVIPGEQADFHVEIANRGSVDDRVTVVVEGLPEGWVDAPGEFISVPAGATAKVVARLKPERRTETEPGRRRFRVLVRSQQYPELEPAATGSLLVGSFEEMDAVLEPRQLELPGVVQVRISNRGNAPATIALTGRDPQGKIHFVGEQAQVRLEPRQRATVNLELRPERMNWFSRSMAHPFGIEVSNRNGTARTTLTGEADIVPVVPPWISYGVLVIVVFACVFSAMSLLFGDGVGRSRAESSTATAQAAWDLQTIVAATATIDAATRFASTPTTGRDTDGDGLSDAQEMALGTLIDDPDTDKDGLPDGAEVLQFGCNPLLRDTDGDGLTDWEEIYLYGTRCDNPDTDGDGISDGVEVARGTDPLVPEGPTPQPTAIVSPTPSLTPSLMPTDMPTLTPSVTSTLAPTETPSVTPQPSVTPTNTTAPPTATMTPQPTATATPNPEMVCFPTAPLIDGQLTDAVWASASSESFVPEGAPGRTMTLYTAQAGNERFLALAIADPTVDDTDEVRIYLDTNRNQGDPDSADRLYIIQRNGAAVVQPGVGTNRDLLTWEANASQDVTAAVGVAEAQGGYWIVELHITPAAVPSLANPFGLMLQITDGVTVFSWPENADPFQANAWQPVANPACP
jgi:eukaryotic-like serine/threonine-protein kinase